MSKPGDDTRSKRQARMKLAMWAVGIIVIAAIFLILAKAVSKSPTGSTGTSDATPASAQLLAKISGLSTDLFTAVGQGSASPLPKPISGAPALTQDSKPLIFYAGAEYCPYCATERWPMVIALLRFGSFSSINTTHSASADVFPNTQTFSFHSASYTSQYIAFRGIELESNQLQGTAYAPLDTPTVTEQSLISTYNAPPYVAKESAGAIPFIDFGGRFLISGSTYDPNVLQNKTQDQIATSLADASSAISKGAVGSANAITAAICSLTDGQPAKVCGTDSIKALQAKLTSQ